MTDSQKVCKVCGKAFTDESLRKNRKTCSKECQALNLRAHTDAFNCRKYKGAHDLTERVCVDCGIIFIGKGLNCGRKVCKPLMTRVRENEVRSSTLYNQKEAIKLRDAYDNFKSISEQVNDRFKEAQNLHGKESPVERMENMLAHGKPSVSHKVMPGRKRKV